MKHSAAAAAASVYPIHPLYLCVRACKPGFRVTTAKTAMEAAREYGWHGAQREWGRRRRRSRSSSAAARMNRLFILGLARARG